MIAGARSLFQTGFQMFALKLDPAAFRVKRKVCLAQCFDFTLHRRKPLRKLIHFQQLSQPATFSGQRLRSWTCFVNRWISARCPG